MNRMTLVTAALLTANLAFAAAATSKDKSKSTTAASATVKQDITGTIKWTGYGVGKTHTGDLNVKSGQIEMKGDDIVGGSFVIDMTSLKTADSPKLQGHLQSADFFDVTKYPEAIYKITQVEAIKGATAGSPTHKIMGTLTIKSKTEPLEMLAVVTKKGNKYTAVATTEIKDRTKYDIVYNSKQYKTISALGDKLIEDHIKLDLNVTTK